MDCDRVICPTALLVTAQSDEVHNTKAAAAYKVEPL